MENWMDEYEELMFGQSHNLQTMDRAAKIKYEHMPDILYKYRSCSDRNIEALEKNLIFSSPVESFNDPFEVNVILSEKAKRNFLRKSYAPIWANNPGLPRNVPESEHDMVHTIAQYYKRQSRSGSCENESSFLSAGTLMFQNITAQYLEIMRTTARRNYNAYCLSSSWNNKLMWAHYGDSHKGFCIGYDIKSLGISHDFVQLTLPIRYHEANEVASVTVDDIDNIDGSLTMYAMCQKSSDWAYEKEWRLFTNINFSQDTHEPCSLKVHFPYAKTVHLGAQISDVHKKRLIQICKQKGIEVYQIKPNFSASTLDSFRIE